MPPGRRDGLGGRRHRRDGAAPGRAAAVRVAVLSGGRSSEHDVSLASGAAVRDGLAEGGHEALDIEIARSGDWTLRGLLAVADARRRAARTPTSRSPCCTARSARTGRSRGCSSCSTSRTSAPASWPRRCAWTRSSFKDLMAQAGLPQVDYVALRDGDDWSGVGDAPRVALLRQAGAARVVGGHLEGDVRGRAGLGAARGLGARPAGDRRGDGDVGLEVECSVIGNASPIGLDAGRDRDRGRLVRLRGEVPAGRDGAGGAGARRRRTCAGACRTWPATCSCASAAPASRASTSSCSSRARS